MIWANGRGVESEKSDRGELNEDMNSGAVREVGERSTSRVMTHPVDTSTENAEQVDEAWRVSGEGEREKRKSSF